MLKSCDMGCGAGSGRTGYQSVPPNNYPFYDEDEKYVPVMQADGGQLSGEGPAGQLQGPSLAPGCKATAIAGHSCRVEAHVPAHGGAGGD